MPFVWRVVLVRGVLWCQRRGTYQFIRNIVNYLWYCEELNSMADSMVWTQVYFRSQLTGLLLFPGGRSVSYPWQLQLTTEVCGGVRGRWYVLHYVEKSGTRLPVNFLPICYCEKPQGSRGNIPPRFVNTAVIVCRPENSTVGIFSGNRYAPQVSHIVE